MSGIVGHWVAVHVIQTSAAMIGGSISGVALWDARRDYRAVRRQGINGLRLLFARWHVRNEAFRFALQMILVWVGVAAALDDGVPFGLHDTILTFLVLLATLANHHDRHLMLDIDYTTQRTEGS